jgi:hypothetical protein
VTCDDHDDDYEYNEKMDIKIYSLRSVLRCQIHLYQVRSYTWKNVVNQVSGGYKTLFNDLNFALFKKSHEGEMQWSFIGKVALFYPVPGGLYGIACHECCLECKHLKSSIIAGAGTVLNALSTHLSEDCAGTGIGLNRKYQTEGELA